MESGHYSNALIKIHFVRTQWHKYTLLVSPALQLFVDKKWRSQLWPPPQSLPDHRFCWVPPFLTVHETLAINNSDFELIWTLISKINIVSKIGLRSISNTIKYLLASYRNRTAQSGYPPFPGLAMIGFRQDVDWKQRRINFFTRLMNNDSLRSL